MATQSTFIIKGMVCNRCIYVVESELSRLGLVSLQVQLGRVTLQAAATDSDTTRISERLKPLGFDLLTDKRINMVSQVKQLVAELISGEFDFPLSFRLSEFLSARMGLDYDLISTTFSQVEQQTIEAWFLNQRIDKVKEFLVYQRWPLADIAFRLNFSSVAHLSRQFKQYTGMTLSAFREGGWLRG